MVKLDNSSDNSINWSIRFNIIAGMTILLLFGYYYLQKGIITKEMIYIWISGVIILISGAVRIVVRKIKIFH
ncbi:MAG: hypothetical protein AB6733_20590 [Clostridiaceae bacterium]